MTQLHYRLTLVILVLFFISGLPNFLYDLPSIKQIIDPNKGLLFLFSVIIYLFFWISIGYYFIKRTWIFPFIIGLIWALASILSSTIFVFADIENNQSNTFLIRLINLLIFGLTLIYNFYFINSAKIRTFKILRIYGVTGLFMVFSFFIESYVWQTSHTFKIFWIVYSILFMLHFVYERNITTDKLESDEVLDQL